MERHQTYSDRVNRQAVALTNCLEPLLHALGWPGERYHLMDALPYYTCALELHDFQHTMEVLNYECKSFKINLADLDTQLMPCLFITSAQEALVVLEKKGDKFIVFDGIANQRNILQHSWMSGTGYYFSYITEQEEAKHSVKSNWFSDILHKYSQVFLQIVFIGFFLNLLALSVPIFSMFIYNQVIASGSLHLLPAFTVGVVIAIIGMIVLQGLQSTLFFHVGARINALMGKLAFERLLFLPPAFTEGASVSAQVLRIRDFDNIRDLFTGSLINIFFELPFVIIFIFTIALLGGSLALIPLIMAGIFALIYLVIHPYVMDQTLRAAKNASVRQELVLETLRHLRIIKYSAATHTWAARHRELAAKSAMTNYKLSVANSFINITADMLMMLSATAVLGFGAIKIMEGSMSVGALIAIMMLIWRLLLPIRMLFTSQTRLHQIRASIRQVNALMKMATERESNINFTLLHPFQGNVRFNRVSVRYPNSSDLALTNLSFNINKGEVVAIIGRNGSGKSTLFKLLLGLYKPQAGSIYIDNQDTRQIDPLEMRTAIGYVPDKPYIFYGTIALNLYLVKPTATEEELEHAIQLAGLADDIQALPLGLQTPLDDNSHLRLPSSFLQRLSLACTYLKNPSILLMDEPVAALDDKGEQALLNAIAYFRGRATIFIITHRSSLFKITDQILLLHEGQLLLAGKTAQTLERLPKEFLQ